MSLTEARDAEAALMGAILQNPTLIAELELTVAHLDPGSPGHDLILAAVEAVLDRDGKADQVMVMQELMDRQTLQRVGHSASRGAAYLHDLVVACPTTTNARYYAERVKAAAQRRAIASIAQRMHQAATASPDFEDALTTITELAIHLELTVDAAGDSSPIEGLVTFEELAARTARERDWVIPDLLERMDRMMLVGPPGGGKSVLTQQVCGMVAAGRHPFEPDRIIRPQRTLLIDLENPPGILAENVHRVVVKANSLDIWNDGHAFMWMRPGGIDLRTPGDQRLLDRVLTEVQPAIVGLSPLYKAFSDRGDSYERTATEVRVVLDRLREKHRVAWWIEHHQPKAQNGHQPTGPIGSSMWERWPEFGRAMSRIDTGSDPEVQVWELVPFRGDRGGARRIPAAIRRGGAWPWTPIWDRDEISQIKGEPI